jgi:hypothetical protein
MLAPEHPRPSRVVARIMLFADDERRARPPDRAAAGYAARDPVVVRYRRKQTLTKRRYRWQAYVRAATRPQTPASTSAYQDVITGRLKTGTSFVQSNQISINVDTVRAGRWSGGILYSTAVPLWEPADQDLYVALDTVFVLSKLRQLPAFCPNCGAVCDPQGVSRGCCRRHAVFDLTAQDSNEVGFKTLSPAAVAHQEVGEARKPTQLLLSCTGRPKVRRLHRTAKSGQRDVAAEVV